MKKRRGNTKKTRQPAAPVARVERGKWAPGASANPLGRPKTDPELVEAFRELTPKARAVIERVMDDYLEGPRMDEDGNVRTPPKAAEAVKASEVALNRGWGVAPQTVEISAPGGGAVEVEVKNEQPNVSRLERIVSVLQRAGVVVVAGAAAASLDAPDAEDDTVDEASANGNAGSVPPPRLP